MLESFLYQHPLDRPATEKRCAVSDKVSSYGREAPLQLATAAGFLRPFAPAALAKRAEFEDPPARKPP
jgi:hypothetical protein